MSNTDVISDGTVLVEPALDRFVVRMGGNRVQTFFPEGCDFENADYYFPDASLVVELKSLEIDKVSDEPTHDKIRAIVERWRSRGEFDKRIYGEVPIRTSNLSETNARELARV